MIGSLGCSAGLRSIGQTRWLARRYQAERLRLLKFRLLTDPRFWAVTAPADGWKATLHSELEGIRKLRREELSRVSQREELPSFRPREICDTVPSDSLKELLDYYAKRRLSPQADYFGRAADRAEIRFLKSPLLVPALFFLGLIGALIDWVSGIWKLGPGRESFGLVGVGALALLWILPALWRGIRAYRGANEFSRNASRSTAKQRALRQLGDRLRAENDPSVVFAELALCDYILGSDQQEWLRLMLGAKWYG